MTSRVGPKGQVVIPQQIRVELGIQPGDEVEMWREGDQVHLRVVVAGSLYGVLGDTDLLGDLAQERATERASDGRR